LRRECKEWAEISRKRWADVRFIDSHVHLSQCEDQVGVLKFARASETLLVAASTSRSDSLITLKFADENADCVVPFVGVHPSEASESDLGWLEDAAGKARGFGEIGLDPSYSEIGEGSRQLATFRAQLSMAERHRMLVQVHSRGAEVECLKELSAFEPNKVLLHWFEEENLAAEAADRGYFISFGPALLYSRKLERIATNYPDDLILSESDGPVTFAALGGAGGAWMVPSVVFKLAELKRGSFEEVADRIAKNGASYVGGGGKG
jgi:TatD DNase family protein